MTSILKYSGPTHNSDGIESVNSWEHRHALQGRTNAHGRAIMQLLKGWEQYAAAHKSSYDSPIGDDGVLGPNWADIGFAIKRLLNGETGGLDCGSIAANITSAIEAQGFKTDGYSLTE